MKATGSFILARIPRPTPPTTTSGAIRSRRATTKSRCGCWTPAPKKFKFGGSHAAARVRLEGKGCSGGPIRAARDGTGEPLPEWCDSPTSACERPWWSWNRPKGIRSKRGSAVGRLDRESPPPRRRVAERSLRAIPITFGRDRKRLSGGPAPRVWTRPRPEHGSAPRDTERNRYSRLPGPGWAVLRIFRLFPLLAGFARPFLASHQFFLVGMRSQPLDLAGIEVIEGAYHLSLAVFDLLPDDGTLPQHVVNGLPDVVRDGGLEEHLLGGLGVGLPGLIHRRFDGRHQGGDVGRAVWRPPRPR